MYCSTRLNFISVHVVYGRRYWIWWTFLAILRLQFTTDCYYIYYKLLIYPCIYCFTRLNFISVHLGNGQKYWIWWRVLAIALSYTFDCRYIYYKLFIMMICWLLRNYFNYQPVKASSFYCGPLNQNLLLFSVSCLHKFIHVHIDNYVILTLCHLDFVSPWPCVTVTPK